MKKYWIVFALCMMLSGCGSVPTFETLGSIPQQSPTQPSKASFSVQLPADAAESAWQGENGMLYTCQDYMITMQSFTAGNFENTVRNLSGYAPAQLTILESHSGSAKRYDWVWTAVGEEGELICRAAVLDDGSYHYCLCVMAPAEQAGELSGEWNRLFASFCLDV